jgi:hypothetical protein
VTGVQRFRRLGLLPLVLALVCARAMGMEPDYHPAADPVSAAESLVERSGSTPSTLARYDFPFLTALVPSSGPVFETVSAKKGSTLRGTYRSGSEEDPDHPISRAHHGTACRVRSMEIALLDVSAELAAARSGFAALRLNIPPPSLSSL